MTGFGRGAEMGENFSVAVELKTVNNRFLDLNLRLPQELQSLEATIKKLISSRLSRGRVEVFLNYEKTGEIQYELNRPLITGYLKAMKQMQEDFALSGEPDINVVGRLPNVLQISKQQVDENFSSGILRAFETALNELETMRETEGASLKKVLDDNLNAIENRLPAIETEANNVSEEYRLRLNKRIGEMLAKTEMQIEIDQSRLAQEVAYLSDRSDISEELARLKSHIEQFRQIMEDQTDVGKRLDFLTQELNREANTILSKSNNLTVKENGLAIKSEIEKIREQIQNVE
jgi:uncharacterized protein (TIGR00255 family)